MTGAAPTIPRISPDATKVGIVGIGNMGTPMAARAAKAGWRVMVHDTDRRRIEAFVGEHGGEAARDLEHLARECGVCITMLPDGHVVRRVALGDGGDCLARGWSRDSVLIDMSSSSPVGTRDLGRTLDELGVAFLDAPVSGGVRGAVAGTLAIMIGGDRALADAADGLLATMGRRFYVGNRGAGHAAKVLNNYVSAAGLAAAAEALSIAHRFGIQRETILDVINASTGRNNSTENKFAQFILNGRFNSGFALGLMAKDLSLAMEVAASCGMDAELGQACLKLWKEAEQAVGPAADHTEIARYVDEHGK